MVIEWEIDYIVASRAKAMWMSITAMMVAIIEAH